mmetsp:Transcript_33536/g.92612  ORF Transcript_33536/g.92612 Transcript_33536/m.92612 type:complete len:231 (-) Transcript_33536:120-812(-)
MASFSLMRPPGWLLATRNKSQLQSSRRRYTWSFSCATSSRRTTWRHQLFNAQRCMASISASICDSIPRTTKFGRFITFIAKGWRVDRSTIRKIFANAPPPSKGSSRFISNSWSHVEGNDASGFGRASLSDRLVDVWRRAPSAVSAPIKPHAPPRVATCAGDGTTGRKGLCRVGGAALAADGAATDFETTVAAMDLATAGAAMDAATVRCRNGEGLAGAGAQHVGPTTASM